SFCNRVVLQWGRSLGERKTLTITTRGDKMINSASMGPLFGRAENPHHLDLLMLCLKASMGPLFGRAEN
ncbi:MAG: hypothetical protein ACRC2T_12295, partial [Thermoguttaceae bacterium]